ncbi:glyoxylate reductase [Salirhabdus euzebyi]|uniref:Glyoxylate/hydroxypyruvate reductase B n=1 Tax=Salirhabdus euzebyi TaxID=394506 RepID=A0A841Q4Y8_9BACI|nr:D-glycerate dehydrogenase [Salirhabdus euzebyi]MBB6453437.1 glyoxylate reductase [Salirhabdus euzebyi]
MDKRIVISRKLPETIISPYVNTYMITMWPDEDKVMERSSLLKDVSKADALLSMLTDKIDKEVIDHAKQLRIIANMAVGYDNIDVDYAREKGIVVTNTPDILTETTADLTFLLVLATARKFVQANRYIIDGQWKNWSPFLWAGTDVHQKTIGIVGMGRIGEAVARRAKGFNMDILYHNRNRKDKAESELGAHYVSFDRLVEKADFVVSMTPLNEHTKDMFNEAVFKKMKKSAIFINTSRGGVVKEKDLYEALQNGEIAGAGLDVFKNEPINEKHPLLQLENVTALPHIGSATMETRTAMAQLSLENIDLVLKGKKPKTPVN